MRHRLRVTLVLAETLPVPPVMGGAITHTTYETVCAMQNPESTVISPWMPELRGVRCDLPDTFYHVNIKEQKKRIMGILGGRQGLGKGREERLFCYLNGVTDLLADLDPDVIQVHNRPEFMPYLSKQFPNTPLVLYMHNLYFDRRVAKAVEQSTHLVFVSHFLANWFATWYPKIRSKTTVIHNSVNTQTWRPGLRGHRKTEMVRKRYGLRKGRTILFVGRTVPEKGIQHLVWAMDLIRRLLPDAKLLVVGSPEFAKVQNSGFLQALKQEAGPAVVFAGYVDRQELPYYHAAADVAVVPSVMQEPFGKVVIEAMAAGVPVVGSRRGGIPEIIEDGVDGMLVDDPSDRGMLAYRIVELLENVALRKAMGQAARHKAVEKFDHRVRLKRLECFYGNVSQTVLNTEAKR